MYAIIYWKNNDDDTFFIKNNNGSIMLFSKLVEADKYADDSEKVYGGCRVINLEGVNE